MKVTILEGCPDIEVVIRCPEASDEVLKIENMLRSLDKKLCGKSGDETHIIDGRDVIYAESVDKRCFIYTSNQIYETMLKLYELEDFTADMGFFRCSKSQIVNIAKIESLCPDFGGRIEITMYNGEKLIVSRQYARAFKERLMLK